MSTELTDLSLLELSNRLSEGTVTSRDATEACLRRIGEVDGTVRAFLRIDAEGALARADAADARAREGARLGPLDGVPLALKDNFLQEGRIVSAASKMLEHFVAPYDATVVQRLEGAGAVLLGHVNQDAFAMGSSTETSAFGCTGNPYDVTRTPGGSSGGSAAAVAAREIYGAMGTDTGGSIRQPAALTNTVGLKPTYGRVSRYGVISYASSLDQPGPLTRTVADAAAMLQVIAGVDEKDATSAPHAVPDFSAHLDRGVEGLRIGFVREHLGDGVDPEVRDALLAAAEAYEAMGATLVDVELPYSRQALATYYLIATAEASSNLARYDGVRYGHRAASPEDLNALYARSRSEGFGPEVKRRILLGTYALSAGFYDAYYVKAQKVRTLIRGDFDQAFQKVDVLMGPTSPVPAFKLGEKLEDPLAMYLMDVFTLPCNLAGLPGISVPCGFTGGGLPIGLQLIGRPWDEAGLLRVAAAYERHAPHHRRAPTL
ncbi:MAG TPA: Asp-tRNA(Asn)/Glu-tRNA(Gln) amidotransferase subunit GatA [Myxococcaceae bacterium]|nr:Asp-tRNA(Asn)/Glu-tRNA(Gln) amidotransferase subunit GatA [Myxococcaceae bacterium]